MNKYICIYIYIHIIYFPTPPSHLQIRLYQICAEICRNVHRNTRKINKQINKIHDPTFGGGGGASRPHCRFCTFL